MTILQHGNKDDLQHGNKDDLQHGNKDDYSTTQKQTTIREKGLLL